MNENKICGVCDGSGMDNTGTNYCPACDGLCSWPVAGKEKKIIWACGGPDRCSYKKDDGCTDPEGLNNCQYAY